MPNFIVLAGLAALALLAGAAIWAGLVIFASDGLWRARRRDALVAASAGK